MTPRQARAARATLSLDAKTVCALADIGKRTLLEFEAGTRAINNVTKNKLQSLYLSRGISFSTIDRGVEVVTISDLTVLDQFEKDHNNNKFEYYDLFDVETALERIFSVNDSISILFNRRTISQCMIMYILKKYNIQQIKLSHDIGFTPSFLNAIIVGKKNIPIARAPIIQPFFQGVVDVAEALRQELKITKQLKDIQNLVNDNSSAWRALKLSYAKLA